MSRVDILVVGAGLVGSAAAWHAALGGASVLLADAGDPNSGASGQNAGSLHFQIERRYLEQGDRLAAEAARMTTLNRLAVDEWACLSSALGADLSVRQDGGLMVAETAAEVALLGAKIRREQEAGLATEMIDGDAARALAPCLSATIQAAGFMATEGHADPKKVTPAFVRAAAAAGADVRLGTRLETIEPRDGGFLVRLARDGMAEQWHARRLLLAAGAWTPRLGMLANLHLPLFPVALTMNVTERVPAMMRQLVQHVGRRLSMKQAVAGNILIGGGWPARLRRGPDGAFDPGLRPDAIARVRHDNLAAAVATAPGIADLNLLRSWTGVTAITSDQLPLVGEVPRLPGLFVAAGGSAFTLGPVFGRLVAGQLLERARAEADAALAVVSPARFEHLNSFMG